MNVWGDKIKVSLFGESHADAVGAIIDGLPSGFCIDFDAIDKQMKRRAPKKEIYSTQRAESDAYKVLSGVTNGKTNGAPLCVLIENKDVRRSDYNTDILRPSHADLGAYLKYKTDVDLSGGGHFSGRLTAPLVFAGVLCRQMLSKMGVEIGAHILKTGDISDDGFDLCDIDTGLLKRLSESDFPLINESVKEKMKDKIKSVKDDLNSIGGAVECAVIGDVTGIGSPFFNSVESKIASLMLSIPGIKGIEFGKGFDFAELDGASANDEIYVKDGKIKTYTNNNSGINGGIANGMPIVFSLAVKPTPSVGREQRSVDIAKMENITVSIKGRHDACIVPRVAVAVENMTAIAILDMML